VEAYATRRVAWLRLLVLSGARSTDRTVTGRDQVVVFLEDIYTTIERTLIDNGHFDQVRATRHTFQKAMSSAFSEAVEAITGRRVVAFMSEVHQDPDVAAEIFILERDEA
jgi:uncharacterized protein YbcI